MYSLYYKQIVIVVWPLLCKPATGTTTSEDSFYQSITRSDADDEAGDKSSRSGHVEHHDINELPPHQH